MVAAAKKYPDVYFEHATGYKTSKNLAELLRRGRGCDLPLRHRRRRCHQEGRVGYVVPFPIPEMIRHANAFALGVQAVHPSAKVKLVWTKSWFDPAKEKKAAESLVAAGADVIGQNVDSPAAGQYAQSKGLPWVGYDSNAQEVRPDLVADRCRLRLGHLLPEAGQGRRRTARGRPGATTAPWPTGSRTSPRTARR